jgi:hypothetical protein
LAVAADLGRARTGAPHPRQSNSPGVRDSLLLLVVLAPTKLSFGDPVGELGLRRFDLASGLAPELLDDIEALCPGRSRCSACSLAPPAGFEPATHGLGIRFGLRGLAGPTRESPVQRVSLRVQRCPFRTSIIVCLLHAYCTAAGRGSPGVSGQRDLPAGGHHG